MDINYYPGRVRIRDAALRDEQIREAAIGVAKKMGKVENLSYNERTASVLVEYDPDSLPADKVNDLLPLAKKLHAKLSFYNERKKDAVLALIGQLNDLVQAWGTQN